MCGNLKAAMELIKPEDFKNMPGVYQIFHATGRDLEKMGDQLKAQTKEIDSLKKDVSGVKQDVSVVNAKVDTLTTVIVEMQKLIKEHFSTEHMQATVVGKGIIEGFHQKKFWLAILVLIGIILLAGIGIYNLLLTNPHVARDIIQAAQVIS